MSLVLTELTSGNDGGNTTSHTTASISPAASSLLLLPTAYYNHDEAINTVASAGLSLATAWTELAAHVYNSSWGNAGSLWYAICNATPGSSTVTWSSPSSADHDWKVIQVTGFLAAPFGTAVRMTNGTSPMTLAALVDANSVAFGLWASDTAATAGAGFTQLGVVQNNTNNVRLLAEYELNVTSVTAGTISHGAGIAVEIKAAAAGPPKTLPEALAFGGLGVL